MKLKKTITSAPILDAIHEIPYTCYNKGNVQIQVQSFDGDKKISESNYKLNKEDLTPELEAAAKEFQRQCGLYLKSLPEYLDAEEVEETPKNEK